MALSVASVSDIKRITSILKKKSNGEISYKNVGVTFYLKKTVLGFIWAYEAPYPVDKKETLV